MKGSEYTAMREKNLLEQNQKLKELGLKPRTVTRGQPNKSKWRDSTSHADDGQVPKQAKLSRGARPGRKRISYYEEDPDDPDFDADDPDHLSESYSSDHSRQNCSDSKPKIGGRHPKTPENTRKLSNSMTIVSSTDIVDVDKNLFCHECQEFNEGDCPKHGALNVINDTPVAADTEDRNRARRTLPTGVSLTIKDSGVFADEEIPARTRFGPYEGKILYGAEAGPLSWEVKKKGKVLHCVDAKDPGISNWMRYVKRAAKEGSKGQHNLDAYQYQGKIFYRSIRPIKAEEELVVWGGNAHGPQPRTEAKKPDKTVNGRDVTFKCSACKIAFISKDYLDRHVRTCRSMRNNVIKGSTFVCSGCGSAYASKEYLDRHMRICRKLDSSNRPEAMFKCSACKCAYATSEYLERHKKLCKEIAVVKGTKDVYPCPGCKSAYTSKDYLDRHVKMCKSLDPYRREPEQSYKCESCWSAFGEEKFLVRHQKVCRLLEISKRTDFALKYECHICHSVYADALFLERHMKVCEGVDLSGPIGTVKPTLECPGCSDKFGNAEFLERHKLSCLKLKPKRAGVNCPNCPRSFLHRIALNRHLKTCIQLCECSDDDAPVKEEDHSCEDRVNPPEERTDAVTEKKTGGKVAPPFVVLERVAYFDGRTDAINDNSFVTKPLRCPDCNEGFSYQARLNAHIKTHFNQALFVCSQCLKTFCNRRVLIDHVMSHNRGE